MTALLLILAGCSAGASAPQPQDVTEAPREVLSPEDLPDAHRPHPGFSLTMGELRQLLAVERPEIRGSILRRPQAFLEDVRRVLAVDPELLWLVDKQTPLPEDYAPADLVELDRYRDRLVLNREGMQLRATIMPSLLAMAEAARQDGIILDLSSAYRSYQYQEWLFGYWVETIGLERAERSSARPGTSQHQLGTAIDFGSITGPFAEHPAGRWLAAEAHRFGFSLSYPRDFEEITGYIFEPWHFRYLSPAGTVIEQQYFGGIQQFLLEFWDRHGETFRTSMR